MLKRTSTPSRKAAYSSSTSSKKSRGAQKDVVEKRSDNASSDIDDLLMQGKNMNDDEFEKFIKVHALDCYWKILAERARNKLEDQLQENRELHHLLDELTKENEQLQVKNEQCEYLTSIFNSIISEADSGIESYLSDDSPQSQRSKMHM